MVDKLIEEWPTIVKLNNNHNHTLSSAAALGYRDMSEDTQDKLRSLFRQGHSPSSALHALKTDLLIEKGDDYYLYACDGRFVPTTSKVSKLFYEEFGAEYGHLSGEQMFEGLNRLIENYNSNSIGKIKFEKTSNSKNFFIVICTPIMLRAHEKLPQSSELVMVDAAGGMDRQRHRVYFFVTPTAAGGIPLNVIITDTECEEAFSEALCALKDMLPNYSFHGKNFPDIFLTDNDLKERRPLSDAFPSSTLLLCQFHVMKAVWSWLCNKKHGIETTQRQELYFLFKRVLNSKSEDEAKNNYHSLLQNEHCKKYPNFQEYITNMWDYRHSWVSCFRADTPIRGNNTTNYVEVIFRLLKDHIFDRVMAYNLTQLVDFIVTRYEAYMEKRLIDFSCGKCPRYMLRNMTTDHKLIKDSDILQVSDHTSSYRVKSQRHKDVLYTVDIENGMCTCYVGQSGKICKHAAAILVKLGDDVETSFNLVNMNTKRLFFFIATGRNPPPGWLLPLCPEEIQTFGGTVSGECNMASSSDNQLTATFNQHIEEKCERLTPEEEEKFDKFVSVIKTGIECNPNTFVPAVRKLLSNFDKYAKTESGLISALHTFGKYSGLPRLNTTRTKPQKRRGVQIGVQPTSVGRRKLCISGKRKLIAGRPLQLSAVGGSLRRQVKDHDYTSLGTVPRRKRKALHNLEDCVYENKTLGGTKKKKV